MPRKSAQQPPGGPGPAPPAPTAAATVHADPEEEAVADADEVGRADPYKLGWSADMRAPDRVTLLRMDSSRMWPLRLLHRAILPVQYKEPFYNQLYDFGHSYSWLAHFMDVLVGDCCARLEPVAAEDGAKEAPKLRRLYIVTLGVLEPYRGRGIGAYLLRALMRDAYQRQEADHIALHVQTTNQKAIAFYEHFGFERRGTVPEYYAQLEDRDAYLLERKVPPGSGRAPKV
eukprot:TRINITY_DN21833_c0_g1_i1.p1 TRINITY_DN21833_c0_g1~~TRINITY_DN21833_c0_g1_i1.p1  ORF type:complete len:255 (+),score=77.15 TRINITY_DN21833_c0_g1_i1:76-765(+)